MLRSGYFWVPFLITLVVLSALFGWQLGVLNDIFWFAPRPPGMEGDLIFVSILIILLSATMGLLLWNAKRGSCPRGMKRTAGTASIIGLLTLSCPCVVLPASLAGAGLLFAAVSPYIIVMRIAAILLLALAIWMMVPKKK